MMIACAFSMHTFGKFTGTQYAYAKKAYLSFPNIIIGTTSNVIANIILIPKFGLMGAASSIIISCVVLNGISLLIGQKLYYIAYEWSSLFFMYLSIFGATFSLLYLQGVGYPAVFIYLLKGVFLAGYILIGYRCRLVTRESVVRVWQMVRKPSAPVAEQTEYIEVI
jgi:O-antigen/teichoic acid export membrane protein